MLRAYGMASRLTLADPAQRHAGSWHFLATARRRVGAEAIFATVPGGPVCRYDGLAVLTTATIGFALGIGTVQETKHPRRAEAGAVVGLVMTAELATLRARLSALADGSDPPGLQRAFTAGMLRADSSCHTADGDRSSSLARR
ncbi:MAG: hypothetical protein ACYDDU_09520 [Dermatophilaceae bacterium]